MTDLPPPCGRPAAAFLSVMPRARRKHSSSDTSGAMRTPPMAVPAAVLSTTAIALRPIAGLYICRMVLGPRSSQKRNADVVIALLPWVVMFHYLARVLWPFARAV